MNTKILMKMADVLIDTAKKRGTISYSQLSERIKNAVPTRSIGSYVGELSIVAYNLGLPLISVLVVGKETGVPGEGFYKLSSELKGITESEALRTYEEECEKVNSCTEWYRLTNFLGEDNSSKYWLIVHKSDTFNENSRLIGFMDSTYNAKHIKPRDIIIYYFSGESCVKGIYEVVDKPWGRYEGWISDHQIPIQPIVELKNSTDFKCLIPKLNLFTNKVNWASHIQGTNSIRELSKEDFNIIEQRVYQAFIENNEKDYDHILEDDESLKNECEEIKIRRIKRNQQIVANIKKKYNNTCQMHGCNLTFKKKQGDLYSEAHHLEPLSDDGSQAESNVVILCAHHHRMFHYGDVKIGDLKDRKRKVYINGEENYLIYK